MLRVVINLLMVLALPLPLSAQQNATIWYQKLPECPCKNPDIHGIITNDGWAKDKGDISRYHKGATASYRSYPPVETSEGLSGQQCCYDAKGNLITSGRAAGTPDKVSSCKGENEKGEMKIQLWLLWKHYKSDVRPWDNYMKMDSSGWKIYNAKWVPNAGSCPVNIK